MNMVNILTFGKKFKEIQSHLQVFADLCVDSEPIFKRNKKHCNNSNKETDIFQSFLFKNIDYNIDESQKNSLINDINDFSDDEQMLLFDFIKNDWNYEMDVNMTKKVTFNDALREHFKRNFDIDIFDSYEEFNVLAQPDNRFSMIKRICPHCEAINANVKEWVHRKYKNKENKTVEYYLQSYICNECDKWFITPDDFKLNHEMKEKRKLDEKISEIHANTGLSFDKIAEVIEITMNINVSHEYIRNIIQKEHDDFIYETKIVPLPEDFKKKGKTSQERGVTDIGTLLMFKKKNMEISGEITIDELFTDVGGKKQYLVSVFANEKKDMPIAVAIANTRHYDVMKRFFDFTFEDTIFKALTSDMLGVYSKIATNEKVPHQQCIFHWMKYTGKKIYDKIKKEEIPEEDILHHLMLFTQMKEIIRSFNKEKVKELVSDFKENLTHVSEFMEDIIDKFFKKLYKLTAYSNNDKIRRTTTQAETFNSLPQIRHKKHTSKKSWNLLLSIASTIKFYKPNYRTLKLRH